VAAARRAGARFSITARLTPTVTAAITGIDEQAWTPIRDPNAIYDEQEQRWGLRRRSRRGRVTAFTGRRKTEHVTAQLIVRRVRRLNPATAPAGKQSELFAVYRYHAVFTDSPESMLAAEATHRDHAIVERIIAKLKSQVEERPARPPALGGVHRQRRLAGLRGDRAQPHPRRRRAGRQPPPPSWPAATTAEPAPRPSEPS
jgi:hypothetical protein